MVDDEREVRAIEKGEDPIAVGRIQRIGNADVGDAMVGEDFRLAELGAAHADRAARDLGQRQVRALVRLRVRPEPLAGRHRDILHPLDVALDARLIHQYARRAQRGEGHRWECTARQIPAQSKSSDSQLPNPKA